jgi:hypothetical protein
MLKIMDIPDPRGRGSFWEAYRACAEENRVRPDRSSFDVNWAKDFANFLSENLSANNEMVQTPGASSLGLPIMAKRYQKRIHSSRYLGEL